MLALVVVASICATLSAVTARATGACDPYDNTTWPTLPTVQSLTDFTALPGTTGLYQLPSGTPTRLSVFMHGYGNDSAAWTCHIADAAANHNTIAFATDYRGNTPTRGWHVQEGAEEAVALAQYFTVKYPTIKEVGILGISMGGNSSGLAVAADATRTTLNSKGKPIEVPLFDWWVDIEGVSNLIEEYALARSVGATGNVFAANAQADIEAECGGAIEGNPGCYEVSSPTARVRDIEGAGLKGIVIVHDIDDGLVPMNQSRELQGILTFAANVGPAPLPIDFVTVARRNDGARSREAGTTLSQNVGDPVLGAAGQTYDAPLAGHGWEGSNTQITIATGFKHFWDLMDNKNLPNGHEWLSDGQLGEQQVA
jgi:pimeloyl-ACP methyl ester carboxylesterase